MDTSGSGVPVFPAQQGTTVAVGAAGQVGRELVATGAVPVTRRDMDLLASPRDLRETALRLFASADTVVNVAAWTAVDAAEDPVNAAAVEGVNATAPGILAAAAAEVGARFLHVSTDYVFSGVPVRADRPWQVDDPVDPVNVYGATKAAGEDAVRAHGGTVVRTAWVWSGPHEPGRDFVSTMADLAASGRDPLVVDDQTGRPTRAGDLAAGLMELSRLTGELPPTLHYTDSGEPVTWFGFAREVFRLLGQDPDRVGACASGDRPSPARRPAWSVLDLSDWCRLATAPPPWRDSLREGLSVAGG
ncbi:MAG: NAD(P)-dependent oxidoreductase [Corynebacterium provencense]|jgi:dTDP-4-dehydrorhamnose reductase|uniref:SDR family oxidoreductase n=1 Tax=Corynebacterium provencense TaxID=1737425 RepID=UPI002989CECE|nr:NAD(P)-dependent oxidoreductase [Corynebacterium provencense]